MITPIYWVLPLISALVWLGTLLGLLLNWITAGSPYLPSFNQGQHIAYISDTGAYRLKPLFIAGSTVTVIFLDLSLIAERWLRHRGKLASNTSWFQKLLSIIAILASIVGAVGLIFLSIEDTYRHPTLHDRGLVVFIVGYIVSAIFICWEYQRLGVHHRQHVVLRASFWLKLSFIIIEIVLAIAYGVESFDKDRPNVAAVLEWILALVFTFYILSFFLDLIPAVRSKHHYSEETAAEMSAAPPSAYVTDSGYANGYTNGYTNGAYVAEPATASRNY